MSKVIFKDRGLNLTAKGFIRDCTYDIANRREIPNEPGKFMFTISGPGLANAVNIRESYLVSDFGPVDPLPVPPNPVLVQQSPAIQQQPAPTPSPAAAQASAPQPQLNLSSQAVLDGLNIFGQSIDRSLQSISAKIDGLKVSAPEQKQESMKDLLLSELMKLDFTSLKLNLIKSDITTALTIIIDGMPPFSLNAKDITAADIVKGITSVFTESAMVIASINQWKKSLIDLQADTEKKVKSAKTANESAGKEEVAKKPDTKKADDKKNPKKEQAEKQAAQDSGLFAGNNDDLIDDELEPEAGFQAQIPETEFPIEESNSGLSPKSAGFQLL